MRARSVVVGVLLAAIVSCAPALRVSGPTPTDVPAASSGSSPTPTRIPTTDRVTIRANVGGPDAKLTVRSVATGEQLRELHDGVLLPDGRTLIDIARDLIGNATVRSVDRMTGATLRTLPLSASGWSLRYTYSGRGGLSANGRWLALVGSAFNITDPSGTWTSRSSFAVVDTALTSPPRIAELDGAFFLDGVSNDGRSLYVFENTAKPGVVAPSRLMAYDLSARQLVPVAGAEVLNMNAFRTDPLWIDAAYSLAILGTDAPFLVRLDPDARSARVLRIPTEKPTASSPKVPPGELSLMWSLAATRDGRTLYAVNGAVGVVNEIDTASFTLRRTGKVSAMPDAGLLEALLHWLTPIADAKMIVRAGALLSQDEKTLYAVSENGIRAIDTSSLSWRALVPDGQFVDLALSPDGDRLYALDAGGRWMLAFDARSGARLGQVDVGAYPQAIVAVDAQ